ncbi:MAG: glycosyltransferase, partial [Planctomycetota bacterium]
MFSFVVPVRNHAAQISDWYQQLADEADALGEPAELIFVDDGSSDQTVASLHRISDRDPRVRYVVLSGRFGRPAAVTAGCHLATGHAVITFDRRCKDWAEVLSRLLGQWREGAEIVHAGGRAPGQAGGWWSSLKRMWYGGEMRPSGAHMRLIVGAAVPAMRTDGCMAITVDQQVEWIGFKQTSVVGSSKPRRVERAVNCDRPYEMSAARYVLPIAAGALALAVTFYLVLLGLLAFKVDAGVETRLTVLVVALA